MPTIMLRYASYAARLRTCAFNTASFCVRTHKHFYRLCKNSPASTLLDDDTESCDIRLIAERYLSRTQMSWKIGFALEVLAQARPRFSGGFALTSFAS